LINTTPGEHEIKLKQVYVPDYYKHGSLTPAERPIEDMLQQLLVESARIWLIIKLLVISSKFLDVLEADKIKTNSQNQNQ